MDVVMNTNEKQIPTIGDVMSKSRINGARAIVVVAMIGFLLIGVVYTGIHNFNLFARTLQADQKLFALIPVILLEGGILLFLAGSFVWFSGGAQKIVATASGWLLFAVIAVNTLVDSLITSRETMPEWLTIYSSFIMYAMPVVVMAILKLIIDLDPSKRSLDMEKAIEYALGEAKFAAAQRALTSHSNRLALTNYGDAFERALAQHIEQSAPALNQPVTRFAAEQNGAVTIDPKDSPSA